MHRVEGIAILIAIVLLTAGCGEPATGPVELRYDRLTCERCRMVLSDPRHSAQVRIAGADGRSVVHPFDDIGCALIWLEGQPGRDDPTTEIWVNDWRNGDWIDARAAAYVDGQVTPMGYGLGAQPGPVPGALTFGEARQRVFEVERRVNVHGGGHHHGQ
jgi:nitrous oxide reductase accessory protein NosL